MSEGDIPSIIALVILLLLSGFFSSSETALIGSKRIRLTSMAEKGSRTAKRALKLMDDPGTLLGTILVGNNMVNIAAAAIAATLIGPVKATVVMTLLLLMVGEIPPKTMAALYPERVARMFAFPISLFAYVFKPVVWITSGLTDILLWPFTRKIAPTRRFFSRDEISTALNMSQDAGELEPGEARMVQEILELPEIQLSDIMIPASEAAFVMRDWSIDRLLDEIRRRRFTRYPVFSPGGERPNGMLHIKDLLVNSDVKTWQSLIRSLPFRKEDTDADDCLRDMQIARFHMCGVLNGENEIVGYVTMERILEEIVGEIADEHDPEADPIRTLDDNKYLVRGDLEIADVSRILNIDLPIEDQETSIATLYRESSKSGALSALHLGRALIRPGKHGYVIELFENGNSPQAAEEYPN